jgi:SEC-C motif domain protein
MRWFQCPNPIKFSQVPIMSNTPCPCQSEKNYNDCCGQYIDENKLPATPEALMRSRYTAYSQANIDYIAATMRGKAAENFSHEEASAFAKAVEWSGLEIIAAPPVAPNETTGYVEFIAYFYADDEEDYLHEKSKFSLEDGRWYYVDGEILNEE